MLLCSIDEVTAGMSVGGAVLHPSRPEVELLSPGVALDETLIARLRWLGVKQVWVRHDAVADLDAVLMPTLSESRLHAYHRLKEDFQDIADKTITATHVAHYRQIVMELTCELIASKLGTFTDQLFAIAGDQFTHAANVAYLSILAGLELETYVVKERSKLSLQHARDVTSLGIGAMLHDIGKVTLSDEARQHHDVDEQPGVERPEGYCDHSEAGYRMLRGSRAPASATQCILNHHQRFGGTGFPDMRSITDNRRKGPQSGREIHIFSRIVAVANALDNLLRDGESGRRPPVAALHDLCSARFNGWFDPVVREVVLRKIPPYPVGSQVRLSDGSLAAVVAPSLRQPCRPVVRLLDDAQRDEEGRFPTIELDQQSELAIAACAGQDVSQWNFYLPERSLASITASA